MGLIFQVIKNVDDVRKSGRTLTVGVILFAALSVVQSQYPTFPVSPELGTVILTPAVEYVWRKIRLVVGLDRTGT